MPQPSSSWLVIRSGDLTVEIDPEGAQLCALKDAAGRDLLWNGDPSVWTGRAPLLFPIVGALVNGTYRLGEQSYHLPRHGFARGKLFTLVAVDASAAVLRLSADAATRKIYPFEFELDMRFEVNASTLDITATVRNLGARPMPASVGFHPAFRWPLPYGEPRQSHGIEFESDEPAPFRRLDAAGLLTPTRHVTPIAARRLALSDSLFVDDVLIFDQINSRSVNYGSRAGPKIRVSFPDSPCLGVWTKPGAPFICIEPWHGVADPEGFCGELAEKPGVFVLAEGAAHSATMSIALLPA